MPVSTERLRNYHVGLKGWITDASPCMVYPHGEHTPEFESESTEVPVERQESYMIEPFMNPSDYQCGPETYLLGVWERYGISVYKPKRQIKGEFIEITMTTTREVIDGVTPSFTFGSGNMLYQSCSCRYLCRQTLEFSFHCKHQLFLIIAQFFATNSVF